VHVGLVVAGAAVVLVAGCAGPSVDAGDVGGQDAVERERVVGSARRARGWPTPASSLSPGMLAEWIAPDVAPEVVMRRRWEPCRRRRTERCVPPQLGWLVVRGKHDGRPVIGPALSPV
jgi:hypothetical protein